MSGDIDANMAASGVSPDAVSPKSKASFFDYLTAVGKGAAGYGANYDKVLAGGNSNVGNAGASGGYKVDPKLPKAVRDIIERNMKNGTPENIDKEIENIPDGTDNGTGSNSLMGKVLESGAKILGSVGLGGAGGGMLGGMFGGQAGNALADKLGDTYTRWIVIVIGVLIIIVGLYMFAQKSTLAVAGEVLDSTAGKTATKLIPAGKVGSLVKGVLS